MKSIYTDYFQKSKVFLYPLLSLRKGITHVPSETFIAWNNVYDALENKFLCLYSVDPEEIEKFKNFEFKFLKSHKLFEAYYQLDEETHLYVFDFSPFKRDLEVFRKGKYSKFSIKTKDIISNFFGEVGTVSNYIQSYINPEEYHGTYADYLGVKIEAIKDVYELCSKPDLDKETLVDPEPENLQIKNKSVSLEKNK